MVDSPRRGEVWLVDLDEPVGHEAAYRRPALVVSDDPSNRHGLVVLSPIGTTKRNYPTRVAVDAGQSGLAHLSFVRCEQVRTVSTNRLVHRLGVADVVAMVEVERVLRLLLRL